MWGIGWFWEQKLLMQMLGFSVRRFFNFCKCFLIEVFCGWNRKHWFKSEMMDACFKWGKAHSVICLRVWFSLMLQWWATSIYMCLLKEWCFSFFLGLIFLFSLENDRCLQLLQHKFLQVVCRTFPCWTPHTCPLCVQKQRGSPTRLAGLALSLARNCNALGFDRFQ